MEVYDNRTFKEKLKDGVESTKLKFKNGVDYCRRNPGFIAEAGVTTVIVLKTATKLIKTVAAARDEADSRKRVYCNDVQSYVKLKREPTRSDLEELRDRMDCGQTKFEALRDMNLLK